MSTFYDEETGTYKNFENEVVQLLEEILEAGSGSSEEQEDNGEE